MNIDDFITRFDKVKSTGSGKYIALCPAHPDKSPSLGIKQTDEGKILIHCFSGCDVSNIIAAVGLDLGDLMPENRSYQKGSKSPKFNKYELFDRLAFESVILSLAIRQLLNGETLAEHDLSRILLAENTINGIVGEVGR
jgi:CHC2 zinc finger